MLDTEDKTDPILGFIKDYYSETFKRFGPHPLGVDWDSQPGQYLRLLQLLKLCEFGENTQSLNDYGCGYGALWTLMQQRGIDHRFDYLGIDLCPAMIEEASAINRGTPAVFISGHSIERCADFTVSSGIFNVKGSISIEDWESYIDKTLKSMFLKSRVGIGVNFMAEIDASRRTKTGLYRTSPKRWATVLNPFGSCDVQVVGDYGLNEFTILYRRS